MRRLLSGFISALIFLRSPTAAADPALVIPTAAPLLLDIPPGPDTIVPIRKGTDAPFDGQLFDNGTALRWGNWLLQYRLRLNADVELARRIGAADAELWKQRYTIVTDKYSAVTVDYQKQLLYWQTEANRYKRDADNPPWYRSPWFGFGLGVVCTGLAVGLSAYAISTMK